MTFQVVATGFFWDVTRHVSTKLQCVTSQKRVPFEMDVKLRVFQKRVPEQPDLKTEVKEHDGENHVTRFLICNLHP
jgi:hypothetical protein